MPPFVHLHVHSEYSPMEGVSTLATLCKAATVHGSTAIALTDTNGLYGVIRFVTTARDAGLTPLIGAELVSGAHRTVILTKTPDGYANLSRLLSDRHCDPSFNFSDAVRRFRAGLILLTDDEPALITWMHDSTEDLYVELTPGPRMHQALTFSRRTGLPPVATNRVRFLQPDGFVVHRLLRAIALNTTLSRLPPEACCAPTHWFMPPALMEKQYPHVPEALENTLRIADACHTEWNFGNTIFPAFRRLPDNEAFTLLREKTYRGAQQRYGGIQQDIRMRIEQELAVIRDKGFAHYFLIVDEIVRQALRTCGRGSVAASIVSYCLNITHVDPIRHHLFFERFLNPGRKDPPDIDIDFPWDERDDILDWVFKTYGGEQAAMVANQNTLGLRASIREVAKVYGMPADEIGRTSTLITRRKDFLWFDHAPSATTWARELCASLQLKTPWPDILHAAVLVQNHFRHLSLHCGGIVIVPDEIRRYVPVEMAAKGVPVIQWEKDQTEEAGLVKIDLLGNRSLAVIRDALAAIERNTGRKIDYATWDPIDDPATQALIRRGNTIGCFYIESPATRLLLKKLWDGMPAHRLPHVNVFEYLVMVSSLVRPAANPFIEEFIRRAQGAPDHPWHPLLKPILADTHGIMVYQEDVTKVAMALADFSVEDADQLRKVISKKHKEKQLRDYYAQFCAGAAKNGATPATIELIWKMIMSFAGYSFCKPHSASYAQVSCKCAYLRAYYPAEFIAAVISNQGGFYATFAYLSEARRMGLTILPPDVNDGEWAYTGSGRTIRMGFMQVKTLPEALGTRIVKERNTGGLFRSFQDFLARVQPERAHARALIKAGCCDVIAGELTRPALLWRLYAGRKTVSGLPIPEDYSKAQKLAHEAEAFGFVVSCHPLHLYQAQFKTLRPIPGSDMASYVGRHVMMIGWLITEKFAETKDGLPMEFATFEDETALYDATIFPKVYRRCCHLLAPDRPYVLRGLIEESFGVVTVTVTDLHGVGIHQDTTQPHPLGKWDEGGVVC
ncbi:MAG: DNA polymerase III subunit alpha [Nitrospirales bacterium]